MAKDTNNPTSTNKVVDYNDTGIVISEPGIVGSKYVVYSKPGDEIKFNFSINDDVRIEVVKGDVQIVFPNTSTLTIVSLAALSFGANAPTVISLEGVRLSIEDLLNKADVLSYDDAKLILTNKDTVSYSTNDPDLVQISTDSETELEAGTPITGTGDTDEITAGIPADVVVNDAVSTVRHDYVGDGSFVVTIYTTDSPYLYDKSNIDVGSVEEVEDVTITTTIYYGSDLDAADDVSMSGVEYSQYSYSNGATYTTDKTSQVVPNVVDESNSTDNLYINSHSASGNMNYVVELNYAGEIQPELIEITVPADAVEAGVTLEGTSGTTLDSSYIDEDGNEVYRLSLLDPSGKSYINISFPEGTSTTFFDLSYQITFFSPSTGQEEQTNISQSIVITPVSSEDDLAISSGDVLSSSPNPIDVQTGSGDDIVIAAGSDNSIVTNDGNDSIFTSDGEDNVDAGSGDDAIWGSFNDDVIDAGDGNDIVYYNNENTGLDDSGVNFIDSYYNTYNTSAGLYVYVGIDEAEATDVYFTEGDSVFSVGDTLVKNSIGVNTLIGVETIYLTDNTDNLYVSSFGDTSTFVDAAGGIDTLYIDDNFEGGAVIDLRDSTVLDTSGTEFVSFSGFENIYGSSNDDYFYSYYNENSDYSSDYTLNAGEGEDTLDYSYLDGNIEFNAAGSVTKYDASGNASLDIISGFEVVVGTSYDDTFYGSSTNSYEFYSGGGDDKLDYAYAQSGLTFDLATGNIYKSTGDDYLDAEYDTFDSWVSGDNVTLSTNDDVIMGTEDGDFQIHAGIGRDTLDYSNLDSGIEVNLWTTGGEGIITKSGGTDTFTTFENNQLNIYEIIGTDYDDSFTVDEGVVGETHLFDGGDGEDTLDYSNFETENDSDTGVTINFEGGDANSYVVKNGGGTDYFLNMEIIVGTDFNDTVNFGASLTNYEEVEGLTIDLGDGQDTVNFYAVQLEGDEGIEVRYEENASTGGIDMVVNLATVPPSEVTFQNTEKAVGTNKDDAFYAEDGVNIGFDGQGGEDVADYTNVTVNLTFDLVTGEVSKGLSHTDEIDNVEIFYGGSSSNTYYVSYENSYTFNGVDGVTDTVSYVNSTQGVVFDLENNVVYKGYDSDGNALYTDTLNDIDVIEASNKNDTFIAYEETTDGTVGSTEIAVDGLEGTDTIDFSSYSEENALDIDITASNTQVVAGGITWDLDNIEVIIATDYDDNFNIDSDINMTVSANDGYDTVVYNNPDYAYTLNVGSDTTVSKTSGSNFYIDTLEGVEEFTLSDGDDKVSIQAGYEQNSLTKIDAGAGTDSLSYAAVDVDLTVNIEETSGINSGINFTVDDGTDSGVEYLGFEEMQASKGDTVFILSSDISDDGSGGPGLILEGNNVEGSYSEVQIDTDTAVVVTLSDSALGTDTITGGIDATISLRDIDKLTLTDGDDVIYASESKNMYFDGAGGTNTLDYSNFSGGANIGVEIDVSNSTVTKNDNDAQFDTFENIQVINGTDFNDTLVVSDLSEDSDIVIDLGAGTDTLSLDVDSALTYNISTGDITDGTDTINIDDYTSIEIVVLSEQDDTIVLEVGYATLLSDLIIDAGGGTDTIDASGYAGEIVFDASSNSIVGDSDTAISVTSVEVIKGSADYENTFYGDQSNSYTYIGGSEEDLLTYQNSSLGVEINVGESQINTGEEGVYDYYEDIDTIIATSASDSVVIDDSIVNLGASGGGLTIQLDDPDSTDTDLVSSDNVTFATSESVALTIDSTGNTSFAIGDDTTEYELTITGVDAFILTDQADTITIDMGYMEEVTISGGADSDTIEYTGDYDMEFDATTNTVSLFNTGDSNDPTEETILQIETISYQGTGTATIYAGQSSYIYEGAVSLDYKNLTTGITVDFRTSGDSNMGEITKGDATNSDYFEVDKVVSITGTGSDDTFILVENTTGNDIMLDGANGTDYVSFESIDTDNNEFGNGVSTGSITDGYSFYNIEGFKLTNQDDTFYAYSDKEETVDGLDGTDTLDYSLLVDYDITIDFTSGIVIKTDTATGTTTSDTFVNFEGATTGDGDDTFVLGDEQIEGTFDAGGGDNSISFAGLTDNSIQVNFHSGDFEATFNDGTDISSYNNFISVTLGTKDDSLVYNYDSSDSDIYSFDGNSGTDEITLQTSSGGQEFYIDANSVGNFKVSATIDGPEIVSITGFEIISVGADDVLIVESNSINSATYQGGNSDGDIVDYSTSSTGVTLNVGSIAADGTVTATTSSGIGGDTLIGIDTVVLTNSSDTVSLVEYAGTDTVLTVDAGSGTDTISLAGYTNAVNVTVDAGGTFAFEGYDLQNFEEYSLTNFDDTVAINDAENVAIGGGEGTDTLDISGSTSGTVLYYDDKNNNVFINNTLNTYTSFENIILTSEADTVNIQVWSNENYSIKIDMGGTDDDDTISFGDYSGSESLDVLVEDGVANIVFSDNATTTDATYIVSNWENIIGTSNDDTFTLTGDLVEGQSYSGGEGDDTLDIVGLTSTSEVELNLSTNTLTLEGNSEAVMFDSIEIFKVGDATVYASDVNSQFLPASYTIEGDNLIVDTTSYSSSVNATYDNDTLTLEAENGSTNVFTYTTMDLTLTNYDDTLTVVEMSDNVTIDMGSQSIEDSLDISGLSDDSDIVLDEKGIAVTSNGKSSTFKGVERLTLSTTTNNVMTLNLADASVTYGVINLTLVANGANDTLNLNIVPSSASEQVVYNFSSQNISSTLSGGSLSLNIEGGFEVYNSTGDSNDNILVSESLTGVSFNAGGGTDVLDFSDFGAAGEETYTLSDYGNDGFSVQSDTDIGAGNTSDYTGIDEVVFTSDADTIIVDNETFGSVASGVEIDAGGQSVGTNDNLEITNVTAATTVSLSGRDLEVGSGGASYSNFESLEVTGADVDVEWDTNYFGSLNTVILDDTTNNTLSLVSGDGETQQTVNIEVKADTTIAISAGVADIDFYNLDTINLGAGLDEVDYSTESGLTLAIDASGSNDSLIISGDNSSLSISQNVATEGVNNSTFTDFETFKAYSIVLEEDAFVAEQDNEIISLTATNVTINQISSQELEMTSIGDNRFTVSQFYYEDAGEEYKTNLTLKNVEALTISNNDVFLSMQGDNDAYSSLNSITVDADQTFRINYALYSPTDGIQATITADSTVSVADTSLIGGGTSYDLVGVDEVYLTAGVDTITIDSGTSVDSSGYMLIDARGQSGLGGEDIANIDGNTISGSTVSVTGGEIELANFETFETTSSTTIHITEESSSDYILSDNADIIRVDNMEGENNTVLLWAGDGEDHIIIGSDYTVEEVSEDTLWLDTNGDGVVDTEYHTGGSYLVITDDNGNTVYIGDADMDDVEYGGSNDASEVSLESNNDAEQTDDVSNISNSDISHDDSDVSGEVEINEAIDYVSTLNHNNHDLDFNNVSSYLQNSNVNQDTKVTEDANNESSMNLESVINNVFTNNEENLDNIINSLDGISDNNLPSVNLINLNFSVNSTEESYDADSLESKIDDSADKITDLQSVLHKHNSNNGNVGI